MAEQCPRSEEVRPTRLASIRIVLFVLVGIVMAGRASAADGDLLWEEWLGVGPKTQFSHVAAANGRVFATGATDYPFGVFGFVRAYRAANGQFLWAGGLPTFPGHPGEHFGTRPVGLVVTSGLVVVAGSTQQPSPASLLTV